MKREKKELLIGAAAVVVGMLMIGMLIEAICARAEGRIGREDMAPVRVAVDAGETAWAIAARYCPEGVDLREYLGWCAEENGLAGMGELKAGNAYIFLQAKED